jgi:hypothetical protein
MILRDGTNRSLAMWSFAKKRLLKELGALDRFEEQRGLAPEEKFRKSEVIRDMENTTLQEEISWRQKSRVLWLKEGDKCTKFFHQIANSNRKSNSIESLSVNGSISSDQQAIRDHVAHFYESLFTEPYPWRLGLDNLAFDSLDAVEASSLEFPFEEKEVLEVVKGMNRDKAPGPDGFSIAFFQDCWDVIKTDLMGFFKAFTLIASLSKALMPLFLL